LITPWTHRKTSPQRESLVSSPLKSPLKSPEFLVHLLWFSLYKLVERSDGAILSPHKTHLHF
jgi:hypothetical protein